MSNIEQKIRETIEKLTKDTIEAGEFLRKFEEATGWEYSFDECSKLLREEQKGKWTHEVRECIDYVDIDNTTYASIHAVEEWKVDYDKQDMYIEKISIKKIEVFRE
jgi:hypothetical protein